MASPSSFGEEMLNIIVLFILPIYIIAQIASIMLTDQPLFAIIASLILALTLTCIIAIPIADAWDETSARQNKAK